MSVGTATVGALLAAQASVHPADTAILAPGRTALTYGELYRHIEHIVNTLNQLGIGRNDRVAVVLPNGPEMAVASLSIMCCATCAPLNPAYQVPEYEFYLDDLNAKALLMDRNNNSPAREAAQSQGIPILELNPILEQAAGLFELIGEVSSAKGCGGFAEAEDTALVLHTSGTTSRPKIVPLTHANLCVSAEHIAASLRLNNKDRCLNIMPLFHIHGLAAALLSSLGAGGSVICTDGYRQGQFYAWLEEHQPTWYTAVPTMHQSILAESANEVDSARRYPLRFIRSSSSALAPSVMQALEAVFQVPVIEAYGMTEASHQMASNPLPPALRKSGSVGLAAGPEVAIMDPDGVLLPAGTIGEIVIRGPNVILSYENNVEANATAFCNGWFRTGDQGRMDEEGYVFITGRLKEIVNRGGDKVSPREVDEVLLAHPAVMQAVAFAVPHETLGEDLAAAVVLGEGQALTELELRQFAFARLADYKVPSQVVFITEIPKGATGKLQRIGLADKLKMQLAQDYTAPRTEVEALVTSIFEEVLGLSQVGVFDNFFALGGDSLTATQTISRIRNSFQVELPIVTMFRRPTPADLTEEVVARASDTDLALISELLEELQGLSEEDVRRLLEEELSVS
jgi:acyl-CoA synthetase (AMP-forming)/AMP-acid ligase II